MIQDSLPSHDVVLLGLGHTNAHVLRMWRMQPIADARLTCVSNFPVATYSGMLPGVLAGLYPPERMEIDLVRLCAAAGARLILGEVTGLNVQRRELLFAERPPLPFDVLSIGLGSVPTHAGLEQADRSLLPVKPMQTFLARLEERLREIASQRLALAKASGEARPSPLRVAVVGGGAGGVEIAFCLPARIRHILGDVPFELTLIDSGERLLPGGLARTAERARKLLQTRGVNVVLGERVRSIQGGQVTLKSGDQISADLVLWVTSAAPPPLLAALDLPKDERGFLLTQGTLKTTADAPIFAVGDTGTLEHQKLPKAGVYAVRQGPVLWENMGRQLRGEPLQTYAPQQGFLKLINTGDGQAIGEYKGFTFAGRWVWRLKDRIDGKFMDMYQNYQPAEMVMPTQASPLGLAANSRPQMRCAGCGGKVGGDVLARALKRLEIPANEHVLLGLESPDDAAVIQSPGGRPLAATVDFFAAPLDDPYLVGRLAALHAASDVLAKGARPIAALAMATIPPGSASQQEQLLFELLAGGLHELKQMGATLAGGHTIEGPQLTIGYTILADQGTTVVRAKRSLRLGDVLVLTKPLGTGVLLAAHMQARCKAGWYEPLVVMMLQSNAHVSSLLEEFDIQGITDVTGFGLAGHLLEMLRPANLSAHLELKKIPLLPGAAELFRDSLESTLAPANRMVLTEMLPEGIEGTNTSHAALFDPQTCGGLLLGVAEDRVDGLLTALIAGGYRQAAVIGQVQGKSADQRRLTIV